MATQLQLRRGNTAQTAVFTGAIAEVTVDTDKNTIVVHDGITAGGYPLALASAAGAGAFGKANSAFDQANLAFDKANSANILAQSAFDSSNTANTWLQANIGAARISDTANSQANVGSGLIIVTNEYQANVGQLRIDTNTANNSLASNIGAARISDTANSQANVGAGLISVTSSYEANVGAARISDRLTTEANVGLGIITANTNLKNYADSTFYQKTGGLISGDVEVSGNITPNSDITWNLGSTSKRWHSLFVGPGSIDLGGTVISNTSGTLSISGASDLILSDSTTPGFIAISDKANSAFDQANLSFDKANSANILAQQAFDSSNTANTWLQANIGAARISDTANSQANVGAGLIIVTNNYQANVGELRIDTNTANNSLAANIGAARISDTANSQANVGSGLIIVTNNYQANVGELRIDANNANNSLAANIGAARISDTANSQANIGAGLILVTNAYQANVGAARIADTAAAQANVGAGLISVTNAYQANVGAARISDTANSQANVGSALIESKAFTQTVFDSSNTKVSKSGDTISGDLTVTGNLTIGGTSTTVSATNLAVSDNMLYLNQAISTTITNAVGDGANVIYSTSENHNYLVGMSVTVTGINPSGYNTSNSAIIGITSNTFTVASSFTGSYVSGGTARARSNLNPDLGFAAGYNDGTYHHAGLFRDASDGIWKFFYNYAPEPDVSPYIDTSNTTFRIADLTANLITDVITLRGLDPLNYANTIKSGLEANVGAARIADVASGQANVGAGLITVTNNYQANVGQLRIDTNTANNSLAANIGAARISDTANSQANVGAGLITVTNNSQANVGAARIADRATTEANVGAGLIIVTNNYQANAGAINIAKVNKSGDVMTGALTTSSTLTGSSLISNTSITLNTNSTLSSTTQTTSSTTEFILDFFSSSVYRSAKYFVQITSGSAYQVIEISLIHDDSTVFLVQYGEIRTGASLATFDANITGGQVRLLSTPTNASTTYKAMKTLIPV